MSQQPRACAMRALALLTGGIVLMGGLTACTLNPRVKTFRDCAPAIEVVARDLKEMSLTKELYYTPLTPSMIGQDARMFTTLGATGYIFLGRFKNDDTPLAGDERLRFTGTVYKRKPSIPERLIGRVPNRLFYEVIVAGKSVALHAGSFEKLPASVCAAALHG